jgi:Tfp pilus assembly protein PilX
MRERIRSQAGVALPVAMGVLLVITLLIASVALTSTQLNNSSSRDRDSKRALAAAEGGL